AGTGISRSLVLGVGCGRGAGDVAACAGAGVDGVQVFQTLERCCVSLEVFRLDERTYVPVEAEPGEVLKDPRAGLGTNAACVEALDWQDHPATCAADREPGDQERPGVTQVEPAGGRRSEAADGSWAVEDLFHARESIEFPGMRTPEILEVDPREL